MRSLLSCIPGSLIPIVGAVFFPFPAANAEAVRMTPEHWAHRADKVEFTKFKGKSAMRLHPNAGQVVLKDLVFTNVKAGDNELLIGVANDFYGWGIVARLDRLDGLEIIR